MQAKRSPLFFSFCILGSVFISYLYSPVFKVLLTVDTSLQAENVIFFRMLIAAVFLWGYVFCGPACVHKQYACCTTGVCSCCC